MAAMLTYLYQSLLYAAGCGTAWVVSNMSHTSSMTVDDVAKLRQYMAQFENQAGVLENFISFIRLALVPASGITIINCDPV